jgi:energy-coupling factor transporter ATP-binding protein EcfA2
MKMQEIEKAENLDAILNAFRLEPLNEHELAKFYYGNTMAIRTGDEYTSPLDDLFDFCTTTLNGNAHLLLGHRGCGKSTELYNLELRLKEAGQPVCIIDFMTETNPFLANCWDIMLMITEGLCRIAYEKDLDIKPEVFNKVFDYLNEEREKVTESDISNAINVSGGIEVKTPTILKGLLAVFASVKSDLKASTVTRSAIKNKMERRASEWIAYIKEIADRITNELSGKQPIIIFENLD